MTSHHLTMTRARTPEPLPLGCFAETSEGGSTMEGPSSHPDADPLSFTRSARRLLVAARRESDRLRHDYIGTEHLVLALTRQSDHRALLIGLGVDCDRVRRLMEETVRPGKAATTARRERPYTSRTKKSFSMAAETARAAGDAAVGVEHILAGLYCEGRNIGAEILQRCGLTAEQVAEQVGG